MWPALCLAQGLSAAVAARTVSQQHGSWCPAHVMRVAGLCTIPAGVEQETGLEELKLRGSDVWLKIDI